MRVSLLVLIVAFSFLSEGCYWVGNSYFLGEGEKRYYLTQQACVDEATRMYPASGKAVGSPKYDGFKCEQKFLFFTLQIQEFHLGKKIQTN